ncbi:Nucleolar GTPase [Trachipleistophora hominis]|uniref:Nucleolar GTP-binding protein 2 n=1 Tax=Trachipleistophora hominis TaxID=72359 RepID=L7JV68_TRAHO|nr:Nucleolar GTPase [Trachipleistophora hominis]
MVKENFYRSQRKTNLLNMYNNRPKYSAYGEILRPAHFQSTRSKVAVIPPNYKLFTSTRTINMNEITEEKERSAYEVLIKKGQVPFSILSERKGKVKLEYKDIHKTKRARVGNLLLNRRANDGESVKNQNNDENEKQKRVKEQNAVPEEDALRPGRSKRIWNELYKVLDTSDVIVHVLDVRYPKMFLCKQVIEYVKQNEHKNMIIVLNKVDLVPTAVTKKNIDILSKHFPTVAMHSKSLFNFYGKNNLMNLLRQYKKIHKKTISVGFVGYPNTGKSSIINVLLNKKSAKTAPLAGETKNWQQVKLDKGIHLFDSPGVIDVKDKPICEDDLEYSAVLMGAVRVEKIKDPEVYVNQLVKIAKEGLEKKYKIAIENEDLFLEQLSQKMGKLNKNGQGDVHLVGKMVLNDWVQGKIPFWVEATDIFP